jgi:hypothetical protein
MGNAPEYTFHESSLTELADAARALIAELREQKTRTRDDRAALVDRTVALLVVLVDGIEPKPCVPHNPEYYLGKGRADIAAQFIAWNASEVERAVRAVRNRTLHRCADLVLGGEAWRWIDPRVGALDERPCYKALNSDDGLAACLRELEAMARGNAGRDVNACASTPRQDSSASCRHGSPSAMDAAGDAASRVPGGRPRRRSSA